MKKILIVLLIVISICLFINACDLWEGDLDIDIGDYEEQLAAWNNLNMLDYQIEVKHWDVKQADGALITVINGIPGSEPSSWLESGSTSTIPDFFSLIRSYEKKFRSSHNNGDFKAMSLRAGYNTEYHYPSEIISKYNGSTTQRFIISLMPLAEGVLEIDTGDYENQLAAWNSRNMLDYRIKIHSSWGNYNYDNRLGLVEIFNVENGIPDNDIYHSDFKNKETIPKIYVFIKEEEERIRNEYNGINRSYLKVQYDTEYHYPVQIDSGIDHLFGRYWRWEITLTPPGDLE